MNLRGGLVFIAVTCGLLVGAPVAGATDRFVSPTGGDAASCTAADRCSLRHALEDVAVSGDDVLLSTSAPYTVSSQIVLSKDNVYFYGEFDPAVINTGATGSLLIDGQADGVFNMNITGSGAVAPLQFSSFSDGSGGSNLDVENTSPGAVGAIRSESDIQLTDSLFVSGSTTGSTVLAGGGAFLNVTAIATAAGGRAATATDGILGGGRAFFLNSILRASGPSDVDAAADGTHAHIAIYKSNLDNPAALNGGVIEQDPGLANQAALPNLNSTFRENAGSPTIDAGYIDLTYPSIYQADLDLGYRCLGAAPDIGADEFDFGDVCAGFTDGDQLPNLDNFDFTAPVVSKFKATKKKGRVTAFTFSSSEPGFARLTYQRKQGKKYKSAGSQNKIAVAGKNTVKRKKLKKGSYRVTLRLLDASGNESRAKKLTFKVK